MTKSEKTALLFLTITFIIGLAIRQYQNIQVKKSFSKENPVEIIIESSKINNIENIESDDKSVANTQDKQQVININTADISALSSLKGIGPSLGKRIIEYRNTHGAFANKEDIMLVKGIGEKLYQINTNAITIHD